MHPANSVIFFTTASGAGYGLLALLAIFAALGMTPAESWFGFAGLGLATALFTAGLLSSTLHLGRPERAWRAFSQWRSSWLSREGVAAIVTYFPTLMLAIGWIVLNRLDGPFAGAAFVTAGMAVLTVVCTAMIYASLTPIQQWNNLWTLPVYLVLAAYTGALLLVALTLAFGAFRPIYGELTLALLVAGCLVKFAYWRSIDGEAPRSTLGSATGLKGFSSVKLFEAPHTEANFIMREMGFQIARKHAQKLRVIAVILLFCAPAVGLAVVLALAGGGQVLPFFLASLAVVSAGIGVATERWLFFAEATHVSMIYYGR